MPNQKQSDPARTRVVERRWTNKVLPVIREYKGRIRRITTREAEKDLAFDLDFIFSLIDRETAQYLKDRLLKLTAEYVERGFLHGVAFANIALGGSPEERHVNWQKINDYIQQTDVVFSGFSEQVSADVKRIIGDAVLHEEKMGETTKKLDEQFGIIEKRAIRIIRTETVRAVNAGAFERYRQEGIEPQGHGMVPPHHPNCRCTIIVKRRGDMMQMVWLAAEDERTCQECADLDGTVI